MSDADLGGEPPCWAHIVDHQADEASADDTVGPLVVDLANPEGSGGAIWSLPHGGDLDANLVRLDAGSKIDAHVNDDVDVMVVLRSGSAELTVDGQTGRLGADHLVLIPRGLRRSIVAGPDGVSYLSLHRRRSPLGITRPDQPD